MTAKVFLMHRAEQYHPRMIPIKKIQEDASL